MKPVKSTDYPPSRAERHWIHDATPESSAQDALIESISRSEEQGKAPEEQAPERDPRGEE